MMKRVTWFVGGAAAGQLVRATRPRRSRRPPPRSRRPRWPVGGVEGAAQVARRRRRRSRRSARGAAPRGRAARQAGGSARVARRSRGAGRPGLRRRRAGRERSCHRDAPQGTPTTPLTSAVGCDQTVRRSADHRSAAADEAAIEAARRWGLDEPTLLRVGHERDLSDRGRGRRTRAARSALRRHRRSRRSSWRGSWPTTASGWHGPDEPTQSSSGRCRSPAGSGSFRRRGPDRLARGRDDGASGARARSGSAARCVPAQLTGGLRLVGLRRTDGRGGRQTSTTGLGPGWSRPSSGTNAGASSPTSWCATAMSTPAT